MGSPYKTVAFKTLGCKLNFTETSTIARDFTSLGYAQVENNKPADIYVINTCSVTENANKKARKEVRKVLRQSPNAKVAIIGCYAQLKPDEIAKIPGVNIVLGMKEKFNLAKYVCNNEFNLSPTIIKSDINSISEFKPSYSYGERTRSFLKIQDGCNYSCSFCTIPLARGISRSANIENTIAQIYEIANSNVKEIVFSGVNIGDFGHQYNEKFIDLIKVVDEVKGIDRFRISSIEPNLLSDEMIEFIASSKKILPHFHIPLQSGSNKILKKMRRRYDLKLYTQKIKKIKSIMPYASIGVDVIVGFPGENSKDYYKTYSYLESLDISYLHVFSYSRRENTLANLMADQNSELIISERSKELQSLSIIKKQQFYKNSIGIKSKVLIESFKDGFLYGLSENYIPMKIIGNKREINKIIPVQLLKIQDENVIGERI